MADGHSHTTTLSAWRNHAGLFCVTLATLMLQLLLTRIFSVTMWYHFAFFIISLAMFGVAFGALIVFTAPELFADAVVGRRLWQSALATALAIPLSFAAHLTTAAVWGMGDSFWSTAIFLGITFALVAVPFTCSGICVCLALTRLPLPVGALYCADLAGAAAGCVAIVALLEWLDAPSAVIAVGAAAGVGAWLFAAEHASRRTVRAVATAVLALSLLCVAHLLLSRAGSPLLALSWVSEKASMRTIEEHWSAFSYLKVYGTPKRPGPPAGWGMSSRLDPSLRVRQLGVGIDSWASTVITGWNGDPSEVDFLGMDVTNLAHHLRRNADVLVVGSGGGRDVLAALALDQRRVLAVELNADLIELVSGRFADFAGHVYGDPRVRVVNDEARSFLARHPEQYDLIQVSMIDTWAATAAGAFVLSENGLYTREAFRLFLDRLKPGGVLSVSRWYRAENPVEIHRLVMLAWAALLDRSIEEPRAHLQLVRHVPAEGPHAPAVATLLVSPDPFSAADIATVEQISRDYDYRVLLTPRIAADPVLAAITTLRDDAELRAYADGHRYDIAPPSDDRPFFFHTVRLGPLLMGERNPVALDDVNVRSIYVLAGALAVVGLFTAACIGLPLLWRRRDLAGYPWLSGLFYFAAIGVGFMLIELSQVQRLSVFLGHPVYGLAVVLFTLLLASGAGAFLSDRWRAGASGWLALLCLVLVLFGLATPVLVARFAGASTPVRIAISVLSLAPVAITMGGAFPLGMRAAQRVMPGLAPWLWGVNGATSVLASVVGLVIALTWGIQAAFWTGLVAYAAALVSARSIAR